MSDKATASVVQLKDYFGMDMKTFRDQWTALTDEEKTWFKEALGDILTREPDCIPKKGEKK
jgi:hypothetical protein